MAQPAGAQPVGKARGVLRHPDLPRAAGPPDRAAAGRGSPRADPDRCVGAVAGRARLRLEAFPPGAVDGQRPRRGAAGQGSANGGPARAQRPRRQRIPAVPVAQAERAGQRPAHRRHGGDLPARERAAQPQAHRPELALPAGPAQGHGGLRRRVPQPADHGRARGGAGRERGLGERPDPEDAGRLPDALPAAGRHPGRPDHVSVPADRRHPARAARTASRRSRAVRATRSSTARSTCSRRRRRPTLRSSSTAIAAARRSRRRATCRRRSGFSST